MPRPKKPGQEEKEVKKRSRNGCWPCKARKVKCGEEKPNCVNCQRQGETCDYSIRLNWDGRTKKKEDGKPGSQPISFESSPPQPRQATPVQIGNGFDNSIQHGGNLSGHSDIGAMRAASPFAPLGNQGAVLPPQVEFMGKPPLPSPAFDSLQPVPTFARQSSWHDAGIGSFQGMTAMPPMRSYQQPPSYPSPADSSFGSPHTRPGIFNVNGQSAHMPPPFPTSNPPNGSDAVRSPNGSHKRVKLSPREETFARNPNRMYADSPYAPADLEDPRSNFQPLTPSYFQPHLSNPLTPAASSTTSDDLHQRWVPKMSPKVTQATQENEVRRVSVNSLLSGSPEPEESRPKMISQAQPESEREQSTAFTMPHPPALLHHRTSSHSQTETYGLDRGLPDLDLPRNNDTGAISGVSPSEHSELDAWLNDFELAIPEFGFGLPTRDTVFAKGGYYASPVPIKIPRKLEPLPTTLLENPMNLLYFHHFLNHTARILVPLDCSENPFKTILPKMAVENTNLLHLLLAYSASHRARLLSHPEPANRIALWVRDVFPSLRHALEDLSNTEISNANLATAIMLASLEIISPSTFGVSVPWQNHLSIARSIIKCRGGGPKSVSRKDPVTFFLTRWLAYLDVLGSLSGRRNEEPLFGGNYWRRSSTAVPLPTSELDIYGTDDEADFAIDCLLGFTTRCVSILARIASLARECDWKRIDSATGKARPEWQPPREIAEEADELRGDLEISRVHPQPELSNHISNDPDRGDLFGNGIGVHKHDEDTGLDATNAAFHWAGLIHLLRRIYNLPRSAPEVQHAVRQIVDALQRVPQGGSAEACLLFPMFTAGVEAEEKSIRDTVLGRIKGVEDVGMCQVGRARALMEEVWRTGKEWEGLVQGEFFG